MDQKSNFPELAEIESILPKIEKIGRYETVTEIRYRNHRWPIYRISFGSTSNEVPVLGLFAGVHGLEKIGTQVVNSILQSFIAQLSWDQSLRDSLKHFRIVAMPLINPGGMFLDRRSNPNGVDLMRNSPSEAKGHLMPLLSGHRISSLLPWYQGKKGLFEDEALAVIKTVHEEVLNSSFALTIDFHSGFGLQDQIWFPYARTSEPFLHLPEMWSLKQIYEETQSFHPYRIEPQASQYLTHGDLWDFLYDEHLAKGNGKVFLPLTLEMGSWMWIKKNPWQARRFLGFFNPMKPHRIKRAMRRHWSFFEFITRACVSWENWADLKNFKRDEYHKNALRRWYE